jgi:hypothetical protein
MADEILLILNNQQKPLVDDYLETVARGGLQKYRDTKQTGIRTGHDLYSHLIRGGLNMRLHLTNITHSLWRMVSCWES